MQKFDCRNMPADVRALFFDSYRQPNNTTVTVYVADERPLIKAWLLENGALEEEDVIISYCWMEQDETTEKFVHDGLNEDDDDDDNDEEDGEPKPKKIKKPRKEVIEDVVEDVFDGKTEDVLIFETETETETE